MWCGFRPEAIKHSCPDHLTLLREKGKMSVELLLLLITQRMQAALMILLFLLSRAGSNPSS